MSYEVLARRLRPTTFDDVVGQSHVTTTLRNALRSDRLPHALLLCGPRGVGKTSIARILARSLNCDQGPTDKPCGTCRSCRDIAGSTSMDVQEIDAASHTGVENVREIRESIRFSAAPGKHRIFIIDEVHMLSQAAFNALLKTLEEPPPRSLFIFATTDPQKMPATVLSRVQRFDLRRLPASDLLESLKQIRASEGLDIPESVLRALIREGEGSFRDVLTLLDRLVSGLGPQIDEARAAEVLGWIDRGQVRAIVDAVLERDPAQALHALERALEHGADPARLGANLLEDLRDLLVVRVTDDPSGLIDAPDEEIAALRTRAASHDPETLQRAFRVLLTRLADLSFAPRPAHALEVAVIRLATLPGSQSLAALIARLDALDRAGVPSGGTPSGGGGSGSAAGARGRGGRTNPAPAAPSSARTGEVRASEAPASAAPETAPAAETSGPPEPPPAEVVARVSNRGSSPEPAQAEPRPIADPGVSASLHAASPPPPAADTRRDVSGGAPPGPPADAPRRPDPEQLRRIRTEAKEHPDVLRVIEQLDAEIRDIRTPGMT